MAEVPMSSDYNNKRPVPAANDYNNVSDHVQPEEEEQPYMNDNTVYDEDLVPQINVNNNNSKPEKLGITIPWDSIKKLERIGKGGFGNVYRVSINSKTFACKEFEPSTKWKDAKEEILKEIETMSELSHENIVRYCGASHGPDGLIIVMELCNGNLKEFVQKEAKLLQEKRMGVTMDKRMDMLIDLATGLHWLHQKNIFHADLKLENILLLNGKIKIADFGLNQRLQSRDELYHSPAGNLLYSSPEKIKVKLGQEKTFNGFKADIYAFALLMWEIMCSQEFESQCLNFTRDEFCTYVVAKKFRPKVFLPGVPESLRGLIETCWDDSPDKRPEFGEIINSLNDIYIDMMVADSYAAPFWKTNFQKKDTELTRQVRWKEFEAVLQGSGFKQTEISKMESALATEGFVTLKRFSQMLHAFGPFFLKEEPVWILEKFIATWNWLKTSPESGYQDVTREQAAANLKGTSHGTYILRIRDTVQCTGISDRYPFALSSVDVSGIFHRQIAHNPFKKGGYTMQVVVVTVGRKKKEGTNEKEVTETYEHLPALLKNAYINKIALIPGPKTPNFVDNYGPSKARTDITKNLGNMVKNLSASDVQSMFKNMGINTKHKEKSDMVNDFVDALLKNVSE